MQERFLTLFSELTHGHLEPVYLCCPLLHGISAGGVGALQNGKHSTLLKCCVQSTSEQGRQNDRTGETSWAKCYIFYHVITVPVF